VRALAERDAAALLAVMAELAALDDADPFPAEFIGTLVRLLHSDEGAYSELDRGGRRFLRGAWWGHGMGLTPPGDDNPADPYWRLRHSHPICSYRERTDEWTTTHMVADFASLRDFRRTAIWDELYRDLPVTDWIDVGLRPTGAQTRVFLFIRARGAFDERDRLMLELLQPHLQARMDRVRAASAAADSVASLEERATDDPCHVVLCSPGGAIEFASAQSRRLLAEHAVCSNGRLSATVVATLARRRTFVTSETNGKRLSLRGARSGSLIVLLLSEQDVRIERLTVRQRAILERVARGETDVEVAGALGIAPATVNKHLEQIYVRLGVHTRTAAAAIL
jgi:DNA-binding CsgD family transcriptional regulator